MLPKFLTHLNIKEATGHQRFCCTFPVLLITLLLLVLQQSNVSSAEKDFNFNDSQVPLIEPKDEQPVLIDTHHQSSTIHQAQQSHQVHHQHNNHHLQQQQQQLHHHQHQQHLHYKEQDPYAVELSHCRYGDNEIVLSLVLKSYNWHDFNESRKAKVLEKLSKFFAIPKEFITMESVTKHELFEMQKVAMKKGNNKCHNNNRKLGRVNFIIGCGSTYFTFSEPITKQIGEQFKTGALDNITGEKFGWWIIWNKQYKTRAQRNRRQIEGSGDDDEDEEYDYDDDYIDESVATTSTTASSHAHRHHHGDETSEITNNMLELTNVENLKNNNVNNNINSIVDNNNNNNKKNRKDDITALKQTDNLNEDAVEDIEEVEPFLNTDKTDTNMLLLNKKDAIDEEIVKSVSQLESVITKTIENTKNLDDIPEIAVDQTDDDLLLHTLVEGEEPSSSSDNLNLNTVYENPNLAANEEDSLANKSNKNKNDFNVAEVLDSLTPSSTTTTTTSTTARSMATVSIRQQQNSSPAFAAAGVNVQEEIFDSTTPSSFNNNYKHQHHKQDNHHLDLVSSPNSSHHDQFTSTYHMSSSPSKSEFVTSSTLLTENTNSLLTTNTHLTPAIETVFNTATTAATSLSTSTLSPLSSSSFSTVSSTILNKKELPSYTSVVYSDNNDDDDQYEEHKELTKSLSHENELMLNTFTTMRTITELTTEQQQQRKHHIHHYQQFYNNLDMIENDILGARTKATTSFLNNLTTVASTPTALFTNGIDLMPTAAAATTTVTSLLDVLTTTLTSAASTSSSSLFTPSQTTNSTAMDDIELPIENNFELNNSNNGKKDETTLEPENTQDMLSKVSSTTPQSVEESSVIMSSINTASTTTISTTAAPVSEVQSSTTALPDYVEPKIENTPPMIKNRINKLAVTAGKSFRYLVPKDTFYDNEDLSNLRLDLTNEHGNELKSNSWLQFNAESREIYGLPLEDAVSKWSYRLTATDSGNESVTEFVEISVQQHRYVRSVNHEINISVKINEKSMHFIDWPLKLIEAIAETLGDADTNSVVVREIRSSSQDPNTATLVYFNETFPNNVCPERAELTNLIKRLDVSRLNDLVQPTLGIKQLTGQLIGNCKETDDIKPKTPTIHIKNVNPVPRNQIDRINATMGHLLVYKVPSDTFFDSNDNELTLSLKTKDHKEISPRHWLQFDSKNEEFYGIPKSGDIGDEEYQLVAEDNGGLTANDALVVVVYPAPKKDFSVYVKFYLAIRHELFNADLQRKFVERIAALFGDATTQNIQIRSINPHHDFDGTIVNIYNTTLFKSHNRCPEDEMDMLRNVYLHDDMVRERVKKALGPELNVTKVQVITAASCNAQTDVTHREFIPTKTDEPLLKSTFSEDYLYTIILPAVIIVAMILIALIIACCLHRRRRKSGKMELGDEEERKSFRTKGIPVIFQDELDEKPEIGNKSPIILKDEKPPLLPPSYNTSNMNGDNDVDEYVPPPAVVVGGREARGKSPATPSYRKPPPYVSP